MPLNCSKPPTSLWVVMYIYIYARKYHIWRKSVSLWAMYIYIYIVSPFVHIHTCMYTITTSIQYTYIMCSHPGVDKNIDVPLSDNRFFMYIYTYIYIRMYRKHQNGQVFQKSIFYLLQDDCIWYIYIQHYPTMKASRLLRHLRHLRVWLLLCRLLLGFALGPKNEGNPLHGAVFLGRSSWRGE
jgi:hypothetical protein